MAGLLTAATRRRRALVPALAGLGLLAAGFVLAPAASAHPAVVSSSPADGSRLQRGATDEPADPAPVFDLAAGSSADDHPAAAGGSDTTLAVTLTIIALVLALGALGVAVFLRPRRGASR